MATGVYDPPPGTRRDLSTVRARTNMATMRFVCLVMFTAGAVFVSSPIGAASLPGVRVCVDAAGQRADCTADDGTSIRNLGTGVHYQDECRTSDRFGRCPSDPMCFDEKNQPARCVGKVVFATARCGDQSVTASSTPDQGCLSHGGVASRY
jgi:hypothetical protein